MNAFTAPAGSPVSTLAHIDANLDEALARLFGWLSIPSISTDAAYAAECREAAEWLKADLISMGFEASLRETPGHPIVIGHRPRPGWEGHHTAWPISNAGAPKSCGCAPANSPPLPASIAPTPA